MNISFRGWRIGYWLVYEKGEEIFDTFGSFLSFWNQDFALSFFPHFPIKPYLNQSLRPRKTFKEINPPHHKLPPSALPLGNKPSKFPAVGRVYHPNQYRKPPIRIFVLRSSNRQQPPKPGNREPRTPSSPTKEFRGREAVWARISFRG